MNCHQQHSQIWDISLILPILEDKNCFNSMHFLNMMRRQGYIYVTYMSWFRGWLISRGDCLNKKFNNIYDVNYPIVVCRLYVVIKMCQSTLVPITQSCQNQFQGLLICFHLIVLHPFCGIFIGTFFFVFRNGSHHVRVFWGLDHRSCH